MTEQMVQVLTVSPVTVYQCYATDDAITRYPLGCQHETPRSAINHASGLAVGADVPRVFEDPGSGASASSGMPLASPLPSDAGQGSGSASVHHTSRRRGSPPRASGRTEPLGL